jgi:hypothetical protein
VAPNASGPADACRSAASGAHVRIDSPCCGRRARRLQRLGRLACALCLVTLCAQILDGVRLQAAGLQHSRIGPVCITKRESDAPFGSNSSS